MRSKLFYGGPYSQIEAEIKKLLNSQPEFLGARTASSTRATGDAIQEILAERFKELLGDLCKEYSADFARRAMADLAFKDIDDIYYVVDVKTHRKEEGFHMPNLTSVERLARFYEDDKNCFVVLSVSYQIEGTKVTAEDVHFVPIEFLSWKCLTIGALGWGQIQIANSDNIQVIPGYSRKKWMLELCDKLFKFYPREIGKINERIEHFKAVRDRWEQKDES
ncbi:MAG: hypothetical protein EHM48_03400 [Planctomycetaceae bacterium]|nr:MAG: hypothetical protein EHM48_03400 [Planctomycetaceae bacterium]